MFFCRQPTIYSHSCGINNNSSIFTTCTVCIHIVVCCKWCSTILCQQQYYGNDNASLWRRHIVSISWTGSYLHYNTQAMDGSCLHFSVATVKSFRPLSTVHCRPEYTNMATVKRTCTENYVAQTRCKVYMGGADQLASGVVACNKLS